MATIAERITDLIGSDYSTIATNSSSDLIDAAINEVADMLPADLLLKYGGTPETLDASPSSIPAIENKKVLLVTRKDAGDGVFRECTPVSIQDFAKAKEADSIYLATKHTPVYYYNTTGSAGSTLEIYPTPTDTEVAIVYLYEYVSGFSTSGSTITDFPNQCIHAVVLKACINLLHAYISDFVQDEEDTELQGMINAQIQVLTAQFQNEIKRFVEPDGTPRGE
jgi:hypothetical protein